MDNWCADLAVKVAQHAQRGRGLCHITVFFDEADNGSPRHNYEYAQPPPH
jgi:hypothetical protein